MDGFGSLVLTKEGFLEARLGLQLIHGSTVQLASSPTPLSAQQAIDAIFERQRRAHALVQHRHELHCAQRLRRAREQLASSATVAGHYYYKLPSGVDVSERCPIRSMFTSPMITDFQLAMVWGHPQTGAPTWMTGDILRPFRAPTARSRRHFDSIRIRFHDTPEVTDEIRPLPEYYDTAQDAPLGSWFIYGRSILINKLCSGVTLLVCEPRSLHWCSLGSSWRSFGDIFRSLPLAARGALPSPPLQQRSRRPSGRGWQRPPGPLGAAGLPSNRARRMITAIGLGMLPAQADGASKLLGSTSARSVKGKISGLLASMSQFGVGYRSGVEHVAARARVWHELYGTTIQLDSAAGVAEVIRRLAAGGLRVRPDKLLAIAMRGTVFDEAARARLRALDMPFVDATMPESTIYAATAVTEMVTTEPAPHTHGIAPSAKAAAAAATEDDDNDDWEAYADKVCRKVVPAAGAVTSRTDYRPAFQMFFGVNMKIASG
ncbi:hypothetical protein JKP88DRAFT_277677 [Tribonema minus]|uniref:Uncharacterized protein n=1 Tax=Tribonema minus TaxID=303371 RepID=A0A835Z0I2_9STRA|nr:hypothetical protein JKP88DRAFT_277677 [Tribonema minus]